MKSHAASQRGPFARTDFVPLEQAQPALRACWEVAKGWDGVVEGDEDAKPNWAHTAGYLEVGSVYNCKLAATELVPVHNCVHNTVCSWCSIEGVIWNALKGGDVTV